MVHGVMVLLSTSVGAVVVRVRCGAGRAGRTVAVLAVAALVASACATDAPDESTAAGSEAASVAGATSTERSDGPVAVASEEEPSAMPTAEPVLAPDEPPAEYPPIEVTSGEGMQPGTVYFTTFTDPRDEEAEEFPGWLHIVDKQTGDIVAAQKTPSNPTMLQPEGDGRASYNTVDIPGEAGAGFTVTHYLVDEDFEILEDFNWPASQDGPADLHDFELLDNGNALLMSYRERQVDLSELGGAEDALVYDTVIAERTPQGETIWLWDGAEHMDLADAAENVPQQFEKEPPAVVDYAHPNSLEVFDDGDVLVSIRHYDCLLRIDRDTGDIVWSMGGPNCADNDFEFIGDPHDGFSHQHDATILDDGNILLFDNGNLRENPVSRVVEYAVDEEAMTAELVWSYDDGRYTPIMASAERLENGNTLIGWGALHDPAITEVTPDGEEVFTLTVPDGQLVYRAYQGDGTRS